MGVGVLVGEGDMFVVTLSLAGAALSPHPLQRVRVSNNGSSTIDFLIMSSRSVRL